MADPADEQAAFRETIRRAEEAAGIARDPDGNEVVSEETPDLIPELPGAVPVQASDQPLSPEPADHADTSEQQQEEPAEPTVDALKTQLAEAEARIEEQKLMIGRQSSEVGETRTAIEALQAQIAAIQAQPAPPASQVVITQELVDSNPALAVQAAFEQRDEQSLAYAFEAWKGEDPTSAAVWLVTKQNERARAADAARIEALEQKIQAVEAPIQKTTEQAQWAQAFDAVKATRPDFIENAERLLSEVAPKYPHIVQVLSSGDAEAKVQALEALYAIDKMGNPVEVQQQLEQQAAQAAEEAEAARTGAAVVVGQTTVGQPAVSKTAEKQEQEQYLHRFEAKPSLTRGWTGRS